MIENVLVYVCMLCMCVCNAKLCMSHLMVEVLVGLWVPTPSSMRHVRSSLRGASSVPRRICPAPTRSACLVHRHRRDHVTTAATSFVCVCVCVCVSVSVSVCVCLCLCEGRKVQCVFLDMCARVIVILSVYYKLYNICQFNNHLLEHVRTGVTIVRECIHYTYMGNV